MSNAEWLEDNQRVLVAEFARLKARLAGEDETAEDHGVARARSAMSSPPAIDLIAGAFSLSNFERDVLLLCAGVEMDRALARRCALLNENRGQPAVTFAVSLAKLAGSHWSALSPVAPLRRWRLIEVRDPRMLTASSINLDERVLHYLAGVNYLDPRLWRRFQAHDAELALAGSHSRVVETALQTGVLGQSRALIQLTGDDVAAKLEVARRISTRCGLALYSLRAAELPAEASEVSALAEIWQRERVLLEAALVVVNDGASDELQARFLEGVDGLVFTATRDALDSTRPQLALAINRPSDTEGRQLWAESLGEPAHGLNGSLDAVVGQFRCGSDFIHHTAQRLRSLPEARQELPELLWRACRESSRRQLADLAQRIEPAATWKDLVLPQAQIATLRQIAAQVRQRFKVYEKWGFGAKGKRGLGISVLFAGESGTGKTMAAEVLANELRLDLYRIDLSSMVSKYIGETEKNLRRVFDAAEDGGAILLFDEADALFGKRCEAKDSHDRYANIEVSYLLQRMEAYRGLAVLTSNFKSALDAAFQRRLRFVVQFPFPDAELRECMWQGVFPSDVPRAAIDYAKLAQLNVAGGSIRNIALNAAFLAADEDTPVGMGHLLQATRAESLKRDRPVSDAETRGWL
jgi:SpoVK/Ycf46/Vps4 family AAA+-type ATPase